MDARRADPALTRPRSAPTRLWTINGDFLALSPYGVARHARETTLALDALLARADPQTAGLALDLVAPRDADLPLRRDATRLAPEFSTPRLPQVRAQLQLPRRLSGGLLSFCNLAPLRPRRHVVCIHDMQTRLAPDSYGAGFRLAHRLMLPALGRRCARVVTVSEQARRDIAAFDVAAAERVTVVGNGVETLFVGDFDEADLAALGRGRPASLRLVGRVGDDELAHAFARAAALLFPSRAEGFGLPAVEAMAFGCPVVAADIPSLREVCGEAALFAGCDDVARWIAATRALVADAGLRADRAHAGRRRAAAFTWEKAARRYLAAMAQIDAADPDCGPGRAAGSRA